MCDAPFMRHMDEFQLWKDNPKCHDILSALVMMMMMMMGLGCTDTSVTVDLLKQSDPPTFYTLTINTMTFESLDLVSESNLCMFHHILYSSLLYACRIPIVQFVRVRCYMGTSTLPLMPAGMWDMKTASGRHSNGTLTAQCAVAHHLHLPTILPDPGIPLESELGDSKFST